LFHGNLFISVGQPFYFLGQNFSYQLEYEHGFCFSFLPTRHVQQDFFAGPPLQSRGVRVTH